MIIININVTSEKHDYFMLQREAGMVFRFFSVTISNNEEEYKKLHVDIKSFCGATGNSNVRIGLESTDISHTNIIIFLTPRIYKVAMINPVLTNMARKSCKLHCSKNDNLALQTICRYIVDHTDEFSPYTPTLYHTSMLKSIARKRYFIAENIGKAKITVNNIVQLIFSEFKKLFSNIYEESALTILKNICQ